MLGCTRSPISAWCYILETAGSITHPVQDLLDPRQVMGSSAPVTAHTSTTKKLTEVTCANIKSLVGVAEAAPAESSALTHQVAKIPKPDGLRTEQ